MLNLLRLYFLKLTLFATLKKTYNESFNQFSRFRYLKKDHLKINSKPGPLMSIVIGCTWSVTIFVNNMRLILPPL